MIKTFHRHQRPFKIGVCEWSLRKGDPTSMDDARQIDIDGVQVTMGTLAATTAIAKITP